MKSIKKKFQHNINFVKPLYRKVKFNKKGNSKRRIVNVEVGSTVKLYGDGLNIIKDIRKRCDYVYNRKYSIVLPGACNSGFYGNSSDKVTNISYFHIPVNSHNFVTNRKLSSRKTKMIVNGGKQSEGIETKEDNNNKCLQVDEESILQHKVPDSWLRVYPAPAVPGETHSSIVFRCFVCQLGLTAILILWTLMWVFVIYIFEGPYETKISLDFENKQNEAVIELATELRQINSMSPKWREAIQRRIEDERMLTMEAVKNGARVNPGRFWDLPGTLLFTIYVMTALGFGAPVPHTWNGRAASLVYALLAVPTHIFLMVNASTCIVVNVEKSKDFFTILKEKKRIAFIQNTDEDQRENPNSELKKPACNFRKKLCHFLSLLCAGHGIPLATLLYYLIGAITFGVLRNNSPLHIIMFPMQFTITGGLEHIDGYVRFFYAIYVEGAMCLFACAVTTVRRSSGSVFRHMALKHRLFDTRLD